MKFKTIFTLTLLSFALVLRSPNTSFAVTWNDCVHEEVNDHYPGECSKYTDTDKNDICDHSEPAPEKRVIGTTNEADKTTDIESRSISDSVNDAEINNNSDSKSNTASKSNSDSTQNMPIIPAIVFVFASLLIIAAYTMVKNRK